MTTLVICLALLVSCGYLLYTKLQQGLIYWMAAYTLAGSLLLSALTYRHVFERGEIAGYTRETHGHLDKFVRYEPIYVGESAPLWLGIAAPLIGLAFVLGIMPRRQQEKYERDYIIVMVMTYPVLALWLYCALELHKPRFESYTNSSLPPIGSYLPARSSAEPASDTR